MSANGTDALFEIIQKELNKIVERGEKLQALTENTSKEAKEQNETKPATQPEAKNDDKAVSSKRMAGGGGSPVDSDFPNIQPSGIDLKLAEMSKKYKSTLEKEIATQAAALDSPRAKCIDADLQKMQLELQESYDVFQNISEKFETIDFSHLRKRIKDLNLGTKRDVVGHARSNELKNAVNEGFDKNRLNDLTREMGEKFRKHPGEFGNIPELSSFFQACTQLEHCLNGLKRQRNDVRDLEERMRRSAEVSYNRINFIKQQLAEDNLKDDFEFKHH